MIQEEFKFLKDHINLLDRFIHGIDAKTPKVVNSWCYIQGTIKRHRKENRMSKFIMARDIDGAGLALKYIVEITLKRKGFKLSGAAMVRRLILNEYNKLIKEENKK